MSSESSKEEEPVDIVLEIRSIESSDEPPSDEWSSLVCFPKSVEYLGIDRIAGDSEAELCAKYITLSDSSVFTHPYFNYPSVKDPGIVDALLQPEGKVQYDPDGRDHYLAICAKINQCPVKMFYNKLREPEIDLKFYGVDPRGVKAMAIALNYNKFVKSFSLKDNFLTVDACFHLGEMLMSNTTLTELNLEGTRIGAEGARRILAGLGINRTLRVLNLNRCELDDAGGEHLATAISNGLDVTKLYLSFNRLGGRTAVALAEAIEFRNTLVTLDMSWNNFFGPMGLILFLTRLGENEVLEELNLSWNAIGDPRVLNGIKNVLKAPNLRVLNLSNNKIKGEALAILLEILTKAKKLHTLDLSYNPLDKEDALKVLSKLRLRTCKVQRLIMDNVEVNDLFVNILTKMKASKAKQGVEVTYGSVVNVWKAKGPDMREIVLNRADFLGRSGKKRQVDVAIVFLEIIRAVTNANVNIVEHKDFEDAVRDKAAMLDKDLIEEIVNAFPGPKKKKTKTIDVLKLKDFVKRKWPDSKLPPTPPPSEPAPPSLPEDTKPPTKGQKK